MCVGRVWWRGDEVEGVCTCNHRAYDPAPAVRAWGMCAKLFRCECGYNDGCTVGYLVDTIAKDGVFCMKQCCRSTVRFLKILPCNQF